MKEKRLAIIIMLFAGTIIAFTCLLNRIKLVPTILYVSCTLLVFYTIGRIITRVIDRINKDAERRAEQLIMEAAFEKNAAEVAEEEEAARLAAETNFSVEGAGSNEDLLSKESI